MTHRILIIEDTPAIARVQKHIAISCGYEAHVAQSLEQAEALINKHQYFCAVVDFILPDAPNGEAIPVTIKAEIPTIVMTGNIDNQTRETVDKYPVIDYITKENKQAYHYLKKQLARLPRNEDVKVLVVEDSRHARMYISSLLYRHKYQVLEAVDGVDALEVLQQNPDVSVIIADNEMPRMNGDELCAEIRRLYSNEDKVIIGVSGSNSPHLSARFLKSGANDYLRKPFNAEEFYCRLSLNVDMLDHIATIRLQANTDYLTKLPNRRYFFGQANQAQKIRTVKQQISQVAMIDIDHFKRINDDHGHDAGDDVLVAIAKTFDKFFANELVARLGGEEFVIYFLHNSSEENLESLKKFRQYIELNSSSFTPHKIPFTISIGLVSKHEPIIDELLKEADKKLYEAKELGRNKVVS
ncbi:Response regulator PleD [Pseudoalteromonas holothuriae]|uniref:diguanylate cyclase n=1 Tax=Pseudoalteromonas holothuriae TaxID=2963714 RepID=A0A9W4QR00_9GAMM|nr:MULTISPECIES: diguanylate cyclase [unclassified Pseudoalteromonas]CAH9049621.1 Response regulator PleD [Pseudoalteromonas sp. CIP111854]CAH9051345.1 Response regulator PleD [Pseudoalteromonas sp. CIP111951]